MIYRFLLIQGVVMVFAWPSFAQQTEPQATVPQPAPAPRPAPVKPKPKPKPVAKPAEPVPELKAKLLERIQDWAVFVYDEAGSKVCFAASHPSDTQPKTLKRTGVVLYITTWQKDGVRNEVSVRQGYAMKANAQAVVTVGKQTFTLTASNDKAFAKDPADERKLLAAMAAGGPLVVKATPLKGAATTDQYSLEGMAAAVQKLQQICP